MSEDNKKTTNYLKVGGDPDYIKLLWGEENNKFEVDKTTVGQTNGLTNKSPLELRKEIEPWLTALFQSERLNLLIGCGLTISQESIANGQPTKFMKGVKFEIFFKQIEQESEKLAKQNGRKSYNIEDQINAANTLLDGLEIYTKEGNDKDLKKNIQLLKENISKNLKDFIQKILSVEKIILNKKESVEKYLLPFLMSFARVNT